MLGLTSSYREKLLSGACTEVGARLPSWDFPPRLGVLALGVSVSRLPGKSCHVLERHVEPAWVRRYLSA
ncbi:hypothetical protein MHYP_G00148610 [Metynnis hypsauchen]